MSQKLLMVGLDGFEISIADQLLEMGQMPQLKELMSRAARLKLDHGAHKRTGLAWQHFSTGMAPNVSDIWSAVTFDPTNYVARQKVGAPKPFLSGLGEKVVAIDVPYFDLRKAGEVRGFSNWGAHEPGVETLSRPAGLRDEVTARFGAYQAKEDVDGLVWPSRERAQKTGERLVEAVRQRADITAWLLTQRLPDWDVAITVVSELHAAVAPMWHGFDPEHPLHKLLGAKAAKESLFRVYEALDDLIGQLRKAAPDAAIMLFSMHGMGPNNADVPSMILLPEFMHRLHFGKNCLKTPRSWRHATSGVPCCNPARGGKLRSLRGYTPVRGSTNAS